MSSSESCGGGGTPSGAQVSGCSMNELVARGQRIVQMSRPVDGYSLEWLVQAYHVGDLTAIATVALRCDK